MNFWYGGIFYKIGHIFFFNFSQLMKRLSSSVTVRAKLKSELIENVIPAVSMWAVGIVVKL